MEDLIDFFKANPLPWLVALFFGVFYWGFRGRARARQVPDRKP